jgi:hypothetical protein
MLHGPLERLVGRSFAARLCTATLIELHRRTFDTPKGTENTAVSRQRTQQFATSFALVEKGAGVGGHFFLCGDSAFGARDDGAQRYIHGDSNDVERLS